MISQNNLKDSMKDKHIFNEKRYEQLKIKGLGLRCANRENDEFEELEFTKYLFLHYPSALEQVK